MSHSDLERSPAPPSFSVTIDTPSEVVSGILAQLMVAMESGCHPTPPLLGRHLVARHCLLGHLGSQRACLGPCEGAQWTLGPGRFVLGGGEVRAAPQLALRPGSGVPSLRLPDLRVLLRGVPWGLGGARVAILRRGWVHEAQEGEGEVQWGWGVSSAPRWGKWGVCTLQQGCPRTGILSLLSEMLRVLPQGFAHRAQRDSGLSARAIRFPITFLSEPLKPPPSPPESPCPVLLLPVCSAPDTCCSTATPGRLLPQGLCTGWAVLSPGTPRLSPSFPLRLCRTSPLQRGRPRLPQRRQHAVPHVVCPSAPGVFSGVPPAPRPAATAARAGASSLVRRARASTGTLPGSN